MIQTNIRVRYRRGRNPDIEPNAITSPSGNAPNNVTKNNFNVCTKPTFNA